MAKRGRKTKWKEEYITLAYRICSETGAIDKALAKILEIDVSTLNDWKNVYPEFSESLKRGKDEFDTEKVEKSLLKRALGFSYTETTREPVIVTKKDLDGVGHKVMIEEKMVITKKVRKIMPPEVGAMIFWLKNRNPKRWRDKQELDHNFDLPKSMIFNMLPPKGAVPEGEEE
jgi:hypothetical protein